MPFIMGLISNDDRYVSIVREAQIYVAETLPFTVCFSTERLSKHEDNLHYDTLGRLELGRRFAKAYLDLMKKGK